MSANSLNFPRADQPDAAPTIPSPLAPSNGANTDQVKSIRMTMGEWKRIHRDFKGTHIGPDGKRWRSVLRPGGMVVAEIIK